MAEFKLGDPSKDDTYIGPLTRPQQADVLDDQVRDAVQKGAKLLLGGKRKTIPPLQGVFYEPTVLDNTNNSMKVAQEESFGPIVAVQKVPDNLDAAVAALNDCQYGLTNSVYTKDASVAEYVSKRVNSGTAYWNCCDRVSPQLPWAGRFGSGVGYTLGEGGIATFVQPKAYHWKSQK
jgi:acyl-CoA reductase-like NAD-dependent aldehyde dehydrogenase